VVGPRDVTRRRGSRAAAAVDHTTPSATDALTIELPPLFARIHGERL
jgi:hypothetical protein